MRIECAKYISLKMYFAHLILILSYYLINCVIECKYRMCYTMYHINKSNDSLINQSSILYL